MRPDALAQGRQQRRRIAARHASDHVHPPQQLREIGLPDRLIDVRERLAIRTALPDAADYADDGHPRRRAGQRPELDARADHRPVAEVPPDERVVDQHHGRRILVIGSRQEPPLTQWNAERFEIAALHDRIAMMLSVPVNRAGGSGVKMR